MGGFANIELKDLQWDTEEERRRAEILYAKFKEEWQGTDYKTRASEKPLGIKGLTVVAGEGFEPSTFRL